jgi:hypothetical protein
MIGAAIDYADRGLAVLPLAPRAKRPLTAHGKDDATSDPRVVREWWARWPNANIGIACRASGLVVIDVDPRNGGDDALHDLEVRLGALPDTWRSITGGGGLHVVFENPCTELRGEIAPGVEIKDLGYVVAPPSVHPSGRAYEWEIAPDDAPLADLPEAWLRECVLAPVARDPFRRRDGREQADALKEIPAYEYVEALTGRTVQRNGFVRCPFHKGGEERTPSLKVYETTWSCFGCPAPAGRRALGGDIYVFAAQLWGLDWRRDMPAIGEALREFFMDFYAGRVAA